jgi:hypothetical protein
VTTISAPSTIVVNSINPIQIQFNYIRFWGKDRE